MKFAYKSGQMICVLLLGLVACTTTNVYQYQYESRLDEVFIKSSVDFSQYKSVIIGAVSVWYPNPTDEAGVDMNRVKANIAKAEKLFHATITDVLDDDYPVTTAPGKGVLKVHAEFIDLRMIPEGGQVPAEFSRYDFAVKPGHITMIVRLLDSVSGEVLARAADLGKEQSTGGEGIVDWDAIASDFEYWASIFREWMDEVHGRRKPA
jgi:hypothetical protein